MQPISFSMLRTFLFAVVNIGCCTYLACLFLSSRSSVATYPWRYFCSSLKVPTVWSNVLEKRHRHISNRTTGMLADSKSELRSLIVIEHGEITNEFLWENVWKKKMLTPAEMYQSTALFFITDWHLCSVIIGWTKACLLQPVRHYFKSQYSLSVDDEALHPVLISNDIGRPDVVTERDVNHMHTKTKTTVHFTTVFIVNLALWSYFYLCPHYAFVCFFCEYKTWNIFKSFW